MITGHGRMLGGVCDFLFHSPYIRARVCAIREAELTVPTVPVWLFINFSLGNSIPAIPNSSIASRAIKI